MDQAETLLGLNIHKVGEELGIGTKDYNLINLEPNKDVDDDNDDKLTYIILGIIGGIVFIGLIILIIVIYMKKKGKKNEEISEETGLIRDSTLEKGVDSKAE